MNSKILEVTLKVVAGPTAGQKKTFNQDVIQVGRMMDCDFSIADPTMSRKHFELIVGSDQVLLRNLSEKNKILIRGDPVSQILLRPNDTITAGETQILVTFNIPQQAMSANDDSASKQKENQLTLRGSHSPKSDSNSPSPSPSPSSHANIVSPLAGDLKNKDRPIGVGGVGISDLKEAERPPSQFPGQAPSASPSPRSSSPVFFLLVVVAIGAGLLVFLFSGNKTNSKKTVPLRETIVTMQNIQKSKDEIENFRKENEQRKNPAYEKAQENFLKGFREYRNGNYARAMEYFASALAFYPEHSQANRYYMLANRKNDEFAQYHFNLGKKYYGIQNYRLCSAHFSVVVKVKKDEKDPIRKEALQYLSECDVKREVRY
ncbi:MAG: FHA domain-containing protein [Bdellovibrionaceae bacterium]|nr:FHA domain-containing protein [Pseudobdellovibrionaceae bacterium]MDW8189549.1 FHA domain-containing protein [Pseudobdellovibrionaceae bacterium]